tara:strand:+ start:1255 stop:1821 length:567 start_codon:yes stop_codon:yes gene_type:complete
MKEAYIICNGASRKEFDLSQLDDVITFGCNALYREWYPTFLVSIDPGITKEIEKSDFPELRHIVPPYEEQFEPIAYNPQRPRSNAGMNAMIEAIKQGYDYLYVMGMDFLIVDNEFTLSNLYDGTDNYTLETRATLNDQIARVGYLEWFCNVHHSVTFRFVFPRDIKAIRPVKAPNVRGLFYDQMKIPG